MARFEDLHVTKLRVGNPAIDKSAQVATATYTIGAEAANAITVNVQLKDAQGKDLAVRNAVHAYLSNDATGDTIESSSAGLSVAAGTDGLIIETATDNCFLMISEADGDIDVVVTETTGANTMYLVLVMPDGRIMPSAVLTFAA